MLLRTTTSIIGRLLLFLDLATAISLCTATGLFLLLASRELLQQLTPASNDGTAELECFALSIIRGN
jgi:hypothetical protein